MSSNNMRDRPEYTVNTTIHFYEAFAFYTRDPATKSYPAFSDWLDSNNSNLNRGGYMAFKNEADWLVFKIKFGC